MDVDNEQERKTPPAVKKAPRVASKKSEEPKIFENNSKDLAFSISESMKKLHREATLKAEQERIATDVHLSRRPTTRVKGGNTLQFPEKDLEEFRRRLILLRQDALGQSATLRSVALEQSEDRTNEEDEGAHADMRLQNLRQVDSQIRVVQQIDEALARIKEGTYGICQECGQLIRKPRLLYMPFVHYCMECQTAMEQQKNGRR